ncbi:unnamed protein product [Angiostrongylus costaricensis]|uniref:Uncharacterized protein n=1 Tax=Angiostrongylus costaricensis TaxID=334426 RepID=A0A0R3Q0H5_ANGCS|nr:unnamed protein product [Angiostrongylus costaricensis]
MSSSRSSGADLECCLHGRGCRAGTKQVNVEEEKQNEGEDEEEYAKSEGKKSSRKDQALERLARQLRYVEEFKERREKRREERARRREERRMSKQKHDLILPLVKLAYFVEDFVSEDRGANISFSFKRPLLKESKAVNSLKNVN